MYIVLTVWVIKLSHEQEVVMVTPGLHKVHERGKKGYGGDMEGIHRRGWMLKFVSKY